MNLLAGLEKFGLKTDETTNLFEEEKKTVVAEDGTTKEAAPEEDTLLLDKAVRCTVCDKVFKTKTIKNGRVKRMEPDFDLRPRFEYIDTVKYGVVSCPFCGYTALTRFFEHLTGGQIKLIKEGVCTNFKGNGEGALEPTVLDYDAAIERYKLALFNTIVKKGKNSEKAYTCLQLSWLLRGKAEGLDPKDAAEQLKACKEEEEAFYAQAFEGFNKAVSTESYPICGMDECTMDFLLAAMAYHFKKVDVASKCIARIQASPAASKKIKEKAYDLKEMIVADIKKTKQS